MIDLVSDLVSVLCEFTLAVILLGMVVAFWGALIMGACSWIGGFL